MNRESNLTLFGLPVVISDEVPKLGVILTGSFPRPERPDMTIGKYAQQCADYWYKLKVEYEAQQN